MPKEGRRMPANASRVRLSVIGRPIDPSYPTNRAILLLSLLALIAGAVLELVQGTAWLASLLVGLQWAGTLFLTWALGRETDPDRPASAFFAAAGALAAAILLGLPSFLLLFWLLLGTRLMNRTTGLPPGILDLIGFYGLSLWLGYAVHWTLPLLAAATVPLAGFRTFPKLIRIALALPCGAIALGILRGWRFSPPAWEIWEIVGLLAIAALTIPVVVSYRRVRSVGDHTGEPLAHHRVQWAIAWAAAAALVLTLIGSASIQELAPVWSALAGAILGWAAEQLLRRAKPQDPVR